MKFNKDTKQSLKQILKDKNIDINDIYRVYYENSDIPLFLNSEKSTYENLNFDLVYDSTSFNQLYLIPNQKQYQQCNTLQNLKK